MKSIEIEGFKVIIEKTGAELLASVPRLPGCAVQAEREDDAVRLIREMIGLYMLELARKKHARKPKKPRRCAAAALYEDGADDG